MTCVNSWTFNHKARCIGTVLFSCLFALHEG
nr:MAG TPA: hypothetical protein [Caudoviricetes sp.]